MVAPAVVRARRARARRDVVLPRAAVRAAAAGGVALAAAAFFAGLSLGRAQDGAQRAGATPESPRSVVAAPVSPRAAASITHDTAAIAAPHTSSAPAPTGTVAAGAVIAPEVRVALAPEPPAALAPAAAAPAPAALPPIGAAPDRGFGLQLGAFESDAEARGFIGQHVDALGGLPVFVVATRIDGRAWYRVRLGEARTRAAAEVLRARLGAPLRERAIVVSHK